MKKFLIVIVSLMLLSCTPVIVKYKPVLENLTNEGDFYFLEVEKNKIGYYPRLWVQPKAGLECEIKLNGIDIISIEKLIVKNNQNQKIVEIRQDSLVKLYNEKKGIIHFHQVEKGKLVKKNKLKELDNIILNLYLKDTLISTGFTVN